MENKHRENPGSPGAGASSSRDLAFRVLIGHWQDPAPAAPGGGDKCHATTPLVGFPRKQPIGIGRLPARSELARGTEAAEAARGVWTEVLPAVSQRER
ncbi:hypothetical protein VULLAG_LOCUS4145 [Vulpes lagopus]